MKSDVPYPTPVQRSYFAFFRLFALLTGHPRISARTGRRAELANFHFLNPIENTVMAVFFAFFSIALFIAWGNALLKKLPGYPLFFAIFLVFGIFLFPQIGSVVSYYLSRMTGHSPSPERNSLRFLLLILIWALAVVIFAWPAQFAAWMFLVAATLNSLSALILCVLPKSLLAPLPPQPGQSSPRTTS